MFFTDYTAEKFQQQISTTKIQPEILTNQKIAGIKSLSLVFVVLILDRGTLCGYITFSSGPFFVLDTIPA